ncbi:MAG: restriction endonuclease FokI C-terminal domain-containing protein [Thermoguttaceae bacterium]|nr:restriction endonuclease FokI C-terminal domain-containing protein [Thermoguttaceae bacterium]
MNTIPDVLSTFSEISLNEEWEGQRESHLTLEEELEKAGIKRVGERRDQKGGGGRTYKAWVASLGLIFTQESTGQIKLTLAGEAIMNGDSPVKVLKNQIIKYQFPSSYSLGRGVDVSPRFKIRPFLFLLRLLMDDRIEVLSQEEIAKIIITEAENESNSCFEYIVKRILDYRSLGDAILAKDFAERYKSSKGDANYDNPYGHLQDIANTIINWLEYTQLVKREEGTVAILKDKIDEVKQILHSPMPFIDRPEEQEYFQRKYGVDPKHTKDTRNLSKSRSITPRIIAENKVKQLFIIESLKRPITKIDSELIATLAEKSGIDERTVEEILLEFYPRGSIGAFMTEYFEMAFRGRDDATDFEKSTVQIFSDLFNYEAFHVGPMGLTPDVLILSDEDGYQAILDTKAYHSYSISNDHHNRMVYNYIGGLSKYSNSRLPLAFFSYISGGFGANIDSQINRIYKETDIRGSAMTVSNMIHLIENYSEKSGTHRSLREIFSVNRQILKSDVDTKL